jgi:hypothetical protein
MSTQAKLPQVDFIGIGVNKAATSWIYRCLKDHPDVCVSNPKEVDFFNFNYEKGPSWYAESFAHCDTKKVLGEYSPSYMHRPEVPKRIHTHYPNARLIVCLRNPLERLLSSYYYNLERGKYRFPSIKKQLENDPNAWENLVEKSMYHKNISRFLEYFPKEQMLIVFFEDIQKNPKKFMRTVQEFIGIDPSFISPTIERKVNVTKKNRMRFPILNRFIYMVRDALFATGAKELIMKIATLTGIKKIIGSLVRWNLRNEKKEGDKKKLEPLKERPIDTNLREELMSHFRPDIEKLEVFTGRNLSHWKK